ncbi:ribonuclease H-like domain-containing protein, partial [Candidatus Woesearchaeota archaeon]|nr:ribonuclease H-like domain-containing protein [Candidatus Woesearchaeota archaeon]
MIRSSFVFLERISHNTEKRFWQSGITDWNRFLDAKSIPRLSPARKGYYDRQLKEAKKHLAGYNSSYFHGKLPCSEAWRLYDHFSDDCLFLDIETTGYYGDITVIGMYDGNDVMTLVKGQSLDKDNLKDIVSRYKMLVTFNGKSFDVPCINRYFGGVIPDIPHLDLRFPLAKLGFTGGLKMIEERLGISRSDDTQGLSGEDAVALWHDYKVNGNTDSLNLLVEYNTEDIVNLKPLARFVFDGMKKS